MISIQDRNSLASDGLLLNLISRSANIGLLVTHIIVADLSNQAADYTLHSHIDRSRQVFKFLCPLAQTREDHLNKIS
jgi:hypothetical protein